MNIEFGGQWTKIKLNILEKYLGFYTKALQNQIFTLHYADAFAGSGEQKFPGIDSQQDLLPREILDGSVRIALKTEPGFHKYHFNDLEHENVERIQEIANNEFPKKQVDCTQKDANKFVPEFCSSLGSRDRAVLFIDPFSTELQWETLKSVAESKKIDMWLLFPFSMILRLTPKNKINPDWADKITRLFGTLDWEDSLYRKKSGSKIKDLFGTDGHNNQTERINAEEVQSWVTNRLKFLFPYVAEPKLLDNNGRPLFLFYFAVSNNSPKARQLADKVIKSVMQQRSMK